MVPSRQRLYQTASKRERHGQVSYATLTTLFTRATSRRVIPKVQTIAAPVGRSHWYERAAPIRLTPTPIPQPTTATWIALWRRRRLRTLFCLPHNSRICSLFALQLLNSLHHHLHLLLHLMELLF